MPASAPFLGLPPWLETQAMPPMAPIQSFFHGFGHGQQAAAAQADREQRAEQIGTELALRQARAAHDYQQTQQEQQLRAQQLAQQLLHQRAMEQQAVAANESLRLHRLAQEKQAADTAKSLEIYRQAQLNKPTSMMRDIDFITGAAKQGGRVFKTPEEEAQYKQSLGEAKIFGPGETIEMTPGGGVKLTRGGKGGAGADLTMATKTKLQQELYSHDSAMETLDHLAKNMDASDFGVRGVSKDLWAKIGGQFGAQIDPNTLDARNALRLLRASLYRSFRSDSNIAEPERKQIEAMFPSEGLVESLPDAISKLNSVKRKLSVESVNAAQRLNVPAPRWAITEFLKNEIQAKRMTKDQAVKRYMEWQQSIGLNAP